MATGDLKNNLRILNSELKKLNVPSNICSLAGLSCGNADAFLDIFDNILQWHSPPLARLINDKGLKPPSKEANKTKFLEGVYLIFREVFNWRPPLTIAQFLSSGFHERKIIMSTEVLRLVNQKIQELEPKAAKTQQVKDTGHSGLKMIYKPKKVVLPLKEKAVNVESVLGECEAKCGLVKGGPCICNFIVPEKSVNIATSTTAKNYLDSDYKENCDPEQVATTESRFMTELAEFKAIVLSKLENLESRISALDERIGTVENAS